MNLISIEDVSKQLKDEPLFEQVSLGINDHDRIGLLGANGAGKSTFLNLVTGMLEPDSGTIAKNRELRLSMLEQSPLFSPGISVQQALYEGNSDMIRLLNAYRQCLAELGEGSSALLEDLTERMDRYHGWDIEHSYLSLLNELGIDDPSLPVDELSGGMKKKAALARALASQPNLLILDEPTNHLDIGAVEWLEQYILSSRLACVVVTHDRYFLDAACTRIFEIDRQRIHSYEGNYAAYLDQKQQRRAQEAAGQSKINAILKDELQWLSRGPRARTGKDKGRKQRIQDLMDAQVSQEQEAADFSSSRRRLGKKVLEIKKASVSYSGNQVIRPFTFSFRRGQRIGLIGPNGSGKSTFLNMITQSVELESGEIELGVHTHFGYYDQMNHALPEEKEVLEFISDRREEVTIAPGQRVSAARFLETFGFDVSYHRIDISRLSGGEKRRLLLIATLMEHPNFLLLDEPTNDLDIQTMRKLEEYIDRFEGCLLIVSHDRAFLDRCTDYLLIFDSTGSIKGYAGQYSDYKQDLEQQKSSKPAGNAPSPAKQRSTDKKKLTFKERREFDRLLEEIDVLESEKEQLEEQFLQPTEDLEIMTKRYETVLKLIEQKSHRWEHLAQIDEG